ncbi:MAG: hypothetical protein JNM63_19860, partial [Spirochaetia bacterium]|nr:hypothetical protein [Spirochaetia bacterium]
EDFFKVNSQIIFSIKNGAVLIPGDRLAIPTLVAGFDYLGAGEVRLGVHLEYLEKEIHFNGALKNSLRDLSGKLQVIKEQSPVDAFTVQGVLDAEGIRLKAGSEMRDMSLAWNYLPSKKEQNFSYAHQNVTLGYFLSWLGWESLVREEKLRWFLAQAHLGVLGDKTVSGVRVDFVEKETDGISSQFFSTDFRLRDLHSGESAAWILQKRNGLPTRWNGSYFGNGGALRAWGLQEEASERMTGSIELENFLFGQIPLSARLTFGSISNGSEWTLYHAPDSGEGAYEKSLTARVTRSSNGALEVVVPRSPAGLELSLVMSADQKKIESFESKMDQFHLRIPADFLGLPFLRDGMVSGRLRLVRENQKAARFESSLELSHAVTQEKWLSSRLSVEKGQLDIQELTLSLGKDKLLVHGGADFAASDGQLRLAYQYGGNQGIFSGRVKNKDGVFSLNFENQEGLEKASVVFRSTDKNLQVNLSKLHLGTDRLLSASGLWSVEGGIRGRGKIALEGMNPWDKSGRLDADYEALYPQIELPRIQYKDDQNTLFGYGQIRLGSKIVYEMNLGDTKDKATLNLSGESTGQDNKATLVVHNLDPTHYKSPIQGFVKGRLRLLATATGSFADPHLTVRGFLDDFRIRGQAANVFTEVIKVGSEWEVRRFEVTRQGKNGRDTLLQVNRGRYHQRKIEVDFQLTDYPLLWATRGNFFFSYDLDENRGFFQSPEYSLDGKTGTLFYTAFERVSEKPGTVQWLLRSPTRNGLNGFVTEKMETELTGKKSASYFLKLAYDQDKTNFARLEGSAGKNKLDLVFTTDHFRVSQLNALAPIVLSEESKGETFQIDYKGRTISGVNMFLALTGTPSKPLLNGKLLASGKIRLIGQGGQAEPFRALVEVEDNVFRFKEAILKFDGGNQFALEGNIAARGLKSVDEFDLHLLSRG